MLGNIITFFRLVFAVAFATAVVVFHKEHPLSGISCVILILIGVAEEMTDIFDGIVARRMKTVSQFGEIFDPLIDSLARLTIYFSLALAGWISFVPPFVMMVRDILVAYTRVIKSIVGGEMAARTSGKWKAIVQGTAIPFFVLFVWLKSHFDTGFVDNLTLSFEIVVIGATLWSLIDYVYGTVPMIRKLLENKPPR